MDAEQCVPTQHFDVPVFEVEDVMGGYGCEVDGRLVIRSICDREVGQSSDAAGWRLSGG